MQTPKYNRFVWSLAIQTLMHAPKFEEPTRFNLYFKNIFDSQYLFRSPVLCTKKIFLSTAVSSFGYLFLLYLLHSVDIHPHPGPFSSKWNPKYIFSNCSKGVTKSSKCISFSIGDQKKSPPYLIYKKTLKLLSNNGEWQDSQGL